MNTGKMAKLGGAAAGDLDAEMSQSRPTGFSPTPMHPRCCAACGVPLLHTCAPHVRLCHLCSRELAIADAFTPPDPFSRKV